MADLFDDVADELFERTKRRPLSFDEVLLQSAQGLVALVQVGVLVWLGFPLWLLGPITVIYLGLKVFKRFTREEDDLGEDNA